MVADSPGDEVADQERSFWEARRRWAEVDEDEDRAGERRRLSRRARRLHLNVRMHRARRQQDTSPPVDWLLLPDTSEDAPREPPEPPGP